MADEIEVFANIGLQAPPILVAQARDGRVVLFDRDALPAVTAALDGVSRD